MKYDREHKEKLLTEYYDGSFDKLAKIMDRKVSGFASGEDVVQSAMLRALVYIESYNPENPIGHWFNRILLNTMKMYKRDERLMGMTIDDEAEEVEPMSEDLTKTIAREKLLHAIIHDVDLMREPDREVIRRFVFLGDRAKAIARETNLSVPLIRKIIARFYADIRERYA